MISSLYNQRNYAYIGMAGKDGLSNAVLGGSSDYLADLNTNVIKVHFAQGEEKVLNLNHQYLLIIIIIWLPKYRLRW